jgi:Leucine-rich repeat (LRR) protein
MLLAAFKFFYTQVAKPRYSPQTSITQEWWDGLSEEWKTILIINQNFQKHHVNIFTLQKQYMNRLNAPGEAEYSEMTTSLKELHEMRRFDLGYTDFYELAIRQNYLSRNDRINLSTLGNLDTLYMVNGPGDLTPLEKFPHLKVLILNYGGIGFGDSSEQKLEVEPLKYLKALKVFHCSSIALKSLTPLEDLVNLEELRCDNSSITSLAPIKKLVSLKRLAFGPKVQDASSISRLVNLEELYLQDCKQLPDLSRLKKLKKLTVSESELALVDTRYRTRSLDFLQDLPELEFLDLNYTSYKGSLERLYNLQNLKAVTLPPVSSTEARAFEKTNKECKVINSIVFER